VGCTGTPADTGSQEAAPLYVGADACGACHETGGTDLPSDTWPGTMMANATRDPLFRAAVAWADQAEPGVGSFCLDCHSPIGAARGHTSASDGSGLDDIDRQGVGCEACHLAASTQEAAPYAAGNAQLTYPGDGVVRGPYGDFDVPEHGSLQDPNLSSSAFCGQCHLVTTQRELVSIDGYPLGEDYPLDTTWLEWQQSDYALSTSDVTTGCIDCHMLPADQDQAVSNVAGSPVRPAPRRHAFVGGNHWGIQAVMAADPDRAAQYPAAFQLALDETLEQLGRAVSVGFTRLPGVLEPGTTESLRVKVENLTGHKFPTGFADSRRAWIQVVGFSSTDTETVLLGDYDAASGELVSPRQTHIYRAVPGRWTDDGGVEESNLVLQDMVLVDTRIPPLGMRPSAVTAPTQEFKFSEYPYDTIDYVDSLGRYRHYDDAELVVVVPEDAPTLVALEARVLYQSITRHYIDALIEGLGAEESGTSLEQAYNDTEGGPPLVIATARVALE